MLLFIMMAFLKMLFITTTVCYITVVGVLYLFQASLIFPASGYGDVSHFENGFKPVEIETPDGETLYSFYHPPGDASATILVFYGNGDAALFQKTKAEILIRAGFGVLLVEYRGYGKSTGQPSEKGLIIDAIAAYDHVRKINDFPIGLYAHSLGTGVAIPLAVERKIFALVLESPFDSLQAVAQRRMPFIPMGLFLVHKFRSDQIIGNINVPILIMHGSMDSVIPVNHARNLAKYASAETVFTEIAGANHNDLLEFGSANKAVNFFVDAFGRRTQGQ